MSAATSSRSCATWSRFPSRSPASAKRKDVQARAELAAEERVLDALVGPGSGPGTRESFRKKLRAGELNDKEIEIEVQARLRRHADVRNPRHARRADGRHQYRRHLRQARRRPHQDAQGHRAGFARHPGQRGIRQAARQRAAHPGIDQGGRAERHRVPRRDRQDRRPRGPHGRRRVARRRAARPVAADRRHHRHHQARAGEDRPRAVHRLRRVPHLQAVRPAARAARPAADPRRAEARCRATTCAAF